MLLFPVATYVGYENELCFVAIYICTRVLERPKSFISGFRSMVQPWPWKVVSAHTSRATLDCHRRYFSVADTRKQWDGARTLSSVFAPEVLINNRSKRNGHRSGLLSISILIVSLCWSRSAMRSSLSTGWQRSIHTELDVPNWLKTRRAFSPIRQKTNRIETTLLYISTELWTVGRTSSWTVMLNHSADRCQPCSRMAAEFPRVNREERRRCGASWNRV